MTLNEDRLSRLTNCKFEEIRPDDIKFLLDILKAQDLVIDGFIKKQGDWITEEDMEQRLRSWRDLCVAE